MKKHLYVGQYERPFTLLWLKDQHLTKLRKEDQSRGGASEHLPLIPYFTFMSEGDGDCTPRSILLSQVTVQSVGEEGGSATVPAAAAAAASQPPPAKLPNIIAAMHRIRREHFAGRAVPEDQEKETALISEFRQLSVVQYSPG